jgi:outer membrane receptor protein involved in Fe transport
LGASPLVPETSTNFSAGVVFETDLGLSLTVDFYQIDVDDRIALSTQFNRGDGRGAATGGTIGAQVSSLLDAAGFDASLGGVNYFTNAIDTRSKGVDVIASWATEGDFGSLSLTAGINSIGKVVHTTQTGIKSGSIEQTRYLSANRAPCGRPTAITTIELGRQCDPIINIYLVKIHRQTQTKVGLKNNTGTKVR